MANMILVKIQIVVRLYVQSPGEIHIDNLGKHLKDFLQI